MKKYFSIFLYSFIHSGINKKEILIRSSFFLVILYIFSKLWQATQFSNGTNQQMMVWYLSITEIIVLSVPIIQVEIENDIRSGDIVYQIIKPIDYLWFKISEYIGSFLFRFITLILLAIPFCVYLSGNIPSIQALFTAYLCAGISGIILIIFHLAIGLSSFKIQDSSPIFWIWQRSAFLFGGLIIPLDFYPSYLKVFSFCLPFASLLYGPARLIFEFSFSNILTTFSALLFWGIFSLVFTKVLYKKMLKALKINGG